MPDKVIDADGHIMEPPDLWRNYLEAKYRERAIRIDKNTEGLECLVIDGKPHRALFPGTLGALGGIGMNPMDLFTPGKVSYLDGCPPGGMDPHERIKVMDTEGIDGALLYPTIGICWEGHVEDGALAAAYCRAYNNWLMDFCRPYPDRLLGVAHISLADVTEAIKELRRVVNRGMKGVFLRADLINGRPHGHPDFDPFWAEAQELDVPVALHVVAREKPTLSQWYSAFDGFLFHFSFLAIDVMCAFTSLMQGGVFERFPRLKLVLLEAGGGWIAHWLDRLDNKFRIAGFTTSLVQPPSHYFRRQCWVSLDPDESSIPVMVELVGEDRFLWASDYPHVDASLGVVRELRERMDGLCQRAQRKILGENAAQLYHLV